MPSLTLNDDGSATVTGFMARSFITGSSHGQLNVLSLNAVATACALFAREHLWLSYDLPSAPGVSSGATSGTGSVEVCKTYGTTNGERNLFEMEENGAESLRETTFFLSVACVELAHPAPASLIKGMADSTLSALPFSVCLEGVVALAHVGKSSVGFRVDLFSYVEGKEQTTKEHVGSFRFLRVHVHKAKRMVCSMPEYLIEHLHNVLAQTRASVGEEAFQTYGMPRIDVKSIIALSTARWADAIDGTAFHPGMQRPHATGEHRKEAVSYRRRVHLRESDFDYNLHCNSTQLSQIIIDAFRGACADTRCLFSAIVPEKCSSAVAADLLIRELRIDFIKEIPMTVAGLEVHLFCSSSDDAVRIIEDYAVQRMYTRFFELYVVCRALPSCFECTEDMYPCTVGTMKIAA